MSQKSRKPRYNKSRKPLSNKSRKSRKPRSKKSRKPRSKKSRKPRSNKSKKSKKPRSKQSRKSKKPRSKKSKKSRKPRSKKSKKSRKLRSKRIKRYSKKDGYWYDPRTWNFSKKNEKASNETVPDVKKTNNKPFTLKNPFNWNFSKKNEKMKKVTLPPPETDEKDLEQKKQLENRKKQIYEYMKNDDLPGLKKHIDYIYHIIKTNNPLALKGKYIDEYKEFVDNKMSDSIDYLLGEYDKIQKIPFNPEDGLNLRNKYNILLKISTLITLIQSKASRTEYEKKYNEYNDKYEYDIKDEEVKYDEFAKTDPTENVISNGEEYDKCKEIYKKYGNYDVDTLNEKDFDIAYKKLILKYHPDRGGDEEISKKIITCKSSISDLKYRKSMT
jgi:hypothetical protein